MIPHKTTAIGIMSGTSLDGLDLVLCRFVFREGSWNFKCIDSTTVPYHYTFRKNLSVSHLLSGEELSILNIRFGHYIARAVNRFVNKRSIKPVVIGSHGHTVFHQPGKGLTVQIGSGAVIAAQTGIDTISDFRSTDVAYGGQGAPLVPAGDELLFSQYDACLNLGGIANISFRVKGKRIAFDICPVNLILNFLARLAGKSYDKNGAIAASGIVNKKLLSSLNQLAYYKQAYPKSTGREWFEKRFLPVVTASGLSVQDKAATCVEHIAIQISKVVNQSNNRTVLLTGGGAHNNFLAARLRFHSRTEIYIPGKTICDYKEAIIFAFLAVLRRTNQINCLSSVTGAEKDSCCGAIYKA
ncbi:MAG: anhydro-N-acetylmuramic acid kinase [Bacteroidia bacterium]|nr:anhydro-N-acetylmuramic acid kinase [Bacteroidia bacterium]MCZ2278119.1 anhydro-N-acetylmuramic acid kinase [Bacteroidia bacterium]